MNQKMKKLVWAKAILIFIQFGSIAGFFLLALVFRGGYGMIKKSHLFKKEIVVIDSMKSNQFAHGGQSIKVYFKTLKNISKDLILPEGKERIKGIKDSIKIWNIPGDNNFTDYRYEGEHEFPKDKYIKQVIYAVLGYMFFIAGWIAAYYVNKKIKKIKNE